MASGGVPYPIYSYLVTLYGPRDLETLLGGFSVVSGLAAGSPVGDVKLKRGVVDGADLWNWFNQARNNRTQAQRTVIINWRNAAGMPMQSWKLTSAWPVRYSGPPLSGQSHDIAIEELEISPQKIMLVTTSAPAPGPK